MRFWQRLPDSPDSDETDKSLCFQRPDGLGACSQYMTKFSEVWHHNDSDAAFTIRFLFVVVEISFLQYKYLRPNRYLVAHALNIHRANKVFTQIPALA